MIYKEVVQTVLQYRSKSWVITDSMMKVLELFHHWISVRLTGKKARRIGKKGWEWKPAEEVIETMGM